jgi:midasin (ATPase involved in ribosome maturation)
MLNVTVEMFNSSQTNSSKSRSSASATVPVSKLLIILSDGRGVFYEGVDKVKSAVQNALAQGIFIIFVILDITDKSSSIFDIKMPIYTPGNPVYIYFLFLPIFSSFNET